MSGPVIGIDPGIQGALALLDGADLDVRDMPTIGDGSKRRVDHAQVAVILDTWGKRQGVRAFIEKVSSMPGNGHAGAFSFGRSTGVVIGCVAACFIPLEEVAPAVWKRAMKTPADKDGARLRASALLPRHAGLWPLKKHDGRAEAALIALYGAQTITPSEAV